MAHQPVEFYVYYQVATEHAAGLLTALQSVVAGSSGQMSLLRRDGAAAATASTWMEIHRGPRAEQTLAAAAAATSGWIDGPRHLERFTRVEFRSP